MTVLLFDLENRVTWWLIHINHVSTKSDDVSNIDTIPRLKAEEIGKSLDEDHISFVQLNGEKKPPLNEMFENSYLGMGGYAPPHVLYR